MNIVSQVNTELMYLSKTAFLCSRKIPASVVFTAKKKKMCFKNEANWKMLKNYKYFFNYFKIPDN